MKTYSISGMFARHLQLASRIMKSNHVRLSSSSPVYFITDSEGNLDSLIRPLNQRAVVDSAGMPTKRFKLIFGGDATSRGKQDLRLLNYFQKLEKHELCDGLVRIIGNRDTMLFRIHDQLHPTRLVQPLHDKSVFFAHVTSEAEEKMHRATFFGTHADSPSIEEIRHEAKLMLDSLGLESKLDLENLLESNELFRQLAVVRLRVMLQYAMGSPNAFELRRKELEEMGEPCHDFDVLDSFLHMIGPNGSLTSHVLKGSIAHVEGNVLFVHGSLSADILRTIQGNHVDLPLLDWIQRFNEVTRRKVGMYATGYHLRSYQLFSHYFKHDNKPLPTWEEVGGFGYSEIHDVVATSMAMVAKNQKHASPIYSSYVHYYRNGVPLHVDQALAQKLQAGGIESIVCGHNPHGDGATSLRLFEPHSKQQFYVHALDNAYAGNTRFAQLPASTNRALETSEVSSSVSESVDPVPFKQLRPDEDPRGEMSSSMFAIEDGRKFIMGRLSNGLPYCNILDETSAPATRYIGTKQNIYLDDTSETPVEVLIKMILDDGSFVGSETHGFNVTNYRLARKSPSDTKFEWNGQPGDDEFAVMPWKSSLQPKFQSKL